MKMTILVGSCLKKRHVGKGVHKWKLCNLQESLWLARIICCFQTKTPKCKHWVIKVLYLQTQMVCSGWLRNDLLCLRLQCSSKRCDVMDWDLTDKDLIKKIIYNPESSKCIMQILNPVLALKLWKEFLIRNSTNMKMMRNLITVSETLQIEQYGQPLQPLLML